MAQHRLTGFDAIFLAAETPGSFLHMMAIVLLDPRTVPGGFSLPAFRHFLAERLPLVPPLRRRLLEVPFGLDRPLWAEDPEFDIDLHLRRAALPSPGGVRELWALASEIEERPLARDRPLWEISLVEGLRDGNLALLTKLHHSLMDGTAGVKFMDALFSREPELPPAPEPAAREPAPLPGPLARLLGAAPALAARPLRMGRAGLHSARIALAGALAAPPEPGPAPTPVRRMGFNARISARRTVATASVPLSRVRAVARRESVTVNDVLLALVGAALRGYLGERGALPDHPLVAAVPVSTHDSDDALANSISFLRASLATDVEDPLARLRAISRATRRGKQAGRSRDLRDNLAEWADLVPPLVPALVARVYAGLGVARRMTPACNLLVSSVPGPPVDLFLAGARLVGLYPLGPIYDGMALNVTALTTRDAVDFGLVACRAALPDVDAIATAIPGALDDLAGARAAAAATRPRARRG